MADLVSRYGEQSLQDNNLGDGPTGDYANGVTLGESNRVGGMGGTGGAQHQELGDVGINWHVMDGTEGTGFGNFNYGNAAGAVGNGPAMDSNGNYGQFRWCGNGNGPEMVSEW